MARRKRGAKQRGKNLGRRRPKSLRHAEKYPLSARRPFAEPAPGTVERFLTLPADWRRFYDQNGYGACTGFGGSELMSLLNRTRFDAMWLWDRAKERDEWDDTNPGDNNGSSVASIGDVLRTLGHARSYAGRTLSASTQHGIAANRWITTAREARAALAAGVPVLLGTDWFVGMSDPVQRGADWWVDDAHLDDSRDHEGGHAYLLEAYSDRRRAARTPNSWGEGHPRMWIPDAWLDELLSPARWGEGMVVTDR